jgi:hypothetical protein
MFGWKTLLMMVMPMLEALGWSKVNEDANDTGKDDILGQAILFGVKIFRAVLSNDTDKLNQLLPDDAKAKQVTAAHFREPTI